LIINYIETVIPEREKTTTNNEQKSKRQVASPQAVRPPAASAAASSSWAEAHDERARRPKVRSARGRRRDAGGGGGRRGGSGTGKRGDGRLRERVGRRGGREERVAAVRGALLLLAVGPAAVCWLGPVGSPGVAGQAEAEDEARDEERRHQAQEDLGGLAHVAAHRRKLLPLPLPPPPALLLLPPLLLVLSLL